MRYADNQKLKRGTGIAIVLTIVLIGLQLSPIITPIERKTVDHRTKILRGNRYPPPEIILIIIDESSLKAMNPICGRWPWPRYILADMVEYLALCGARSIGMDILLTENQIDPTASGMSMGSDDAALVDATSRAGNLYHAAQFLNDSPDEFNRGLLGRPLPAFFSDRFGVTMETEQPSVTHNNFYLPFDELVRVSKGIGVVSFDADPDGVFRTEKLIFDYQGNYIPSLALVPLLDRFGTKALELGKGTLELKGGARDLSIPISKDNRYHVNMYGRYDAYSFGGVYLSLLKIARGEMDDLPVDPSVFMDKMVFIGASAAGVEDLKNTAMGPKTPGVYLHASIYGNLISEDFLKFVHPSINILVGGFLSFGIVFTILLFRTVRLRILIPLGLLCSYPLLALMLFKYNVVLAVAAPMITGFGAFAVPFVYIGFSEGKERRKIKNILGQYVSPSVLADVLVDCKGECLRAEVGHRETLSIFFSDIRGFTTIAERYTVEKVVEVLNAYLSRMVDIIFHNAGTLDKFIGDAIVAFWGAPLRDQNHAANAVASAVAMRRALRELNEVNVIKGLPELNMGIGIHTGEVILGNIGSRKKLDYTIIGDGVNLTSRLEGLTKRYNASILVSQDTFRIVHNEFPCRIIDCVKVKGKQKPITIYEVLDSENPVQTDAQQNIITLSEEGFECYRKRKFSEAILVYQRLLEYKPGDFTSRMFIGRSREYLHAPPPEDWDGYYVYKTK
jgi:adenylate cyclase